MALVGYPSAGKSSLISVLSAAKPKIADYPFTTLVPNLGVVTAGATVYTIADVPGLIPGASQGKGLGLEFLRHVERCSVLVHVLDTATLESERDPVSDLDIIEEELSSTAASAPAARIVVLNKIDVPDGKDLAEMVATGAGGARLPRLRGVRGGPHGPEGAVLRPRRDGGRRRGPPSRRRRRPGSSSGPRPSTTPASPSAGRRTALFRVRGEKPERWVRQTDFNNDEAVGYLADRLNRLGVEDALMKAGARGGDGVAIGPEDNAVVFDWEPSVTAGAEMLGRRGEDHRFEAPRPATQRRRDKQAERDEAAQEFEGFEPF